MIFNVFSLIFLPIIAAQTKDSNVKLPYCVSETKCKNSRCVVSLRTNVMPNADVRLELFHGKMYNVTTFQLTLTKLGEQAPTTGPELYQDVFELTYQVDNAMLDARSLLPIDVPYLSETLSPLYFDRGDVIFQRDENGKITSMRTCPIIFFEPIKAGIRFCANVKDNDKGKLKFVEETSQPQVVKGQYYKEQEDAYEDYSFFAAGYKARFTKVAGKDCHLFKPEKDNQEFKE